VSSTSAGIDGASPIKPGDLYHTGFMVPDLVEAMGHLSSAAGYRWTIPIEADIAIRSATGDSSLHVRFVYSLDAPHVELIQQIPGTLWMPAPANAAHHLGYFADDIAATAQRLVDLGYELEAAGILDGVSPAMFAYLKDTAGVRIEIVDRAQIPDFPAMLRGLTPE
jgi:hypothetical protein